MKPRPKAMTIPRFCAGRQTIDYELKAEYVPSRCGCMNSQTTS